MDHADCVLALECRNNVAEVFGVRTYQDCHAVLRRFNNAVPATGHEAAADECDIGKGIETRKLSNGVNEQNAARKRFAIPTRAFPDLKFQLSSEASNVGETFRTPRREQHDGGRISAEHMSKSTQHKMFFALDRGVEFLRDVPF